MRNRQTKGAAVIALVLAILFIGKMIESRQRGVATGETVKLGFIAPLTGTFASFGESIRHGVELAQEDTKRSYVIDYQDEASCDSKLAVSAATKLLTVDNIKLIIGPGCAGGVQAIAPLAKQHKGLLFSTGLLGDAIFAETSSVLNLATQISTEARVMAQYIASQNQKRVAIIPANDLFGKEYGDRLPEALRGHGVETVFNEAQAVGLGDYRTVVAKALAQKPDAIWVNLGPSQIGLFAKQMREAGSLIPIYSLYTAESPEMVQAAGSAADGIRYTYPLGTADESQPKKDFEERYQSRFGMAPSSNSYYVYDGMILLDKALDECDSSDTGCIAETFKSYGTYQGVSGKMKFEKDGSNTRPFGIKQVKGGNFEWLEKNVK